MGVWIQGLLEKRKKANDNYSQLLNDGEPVEDPIYDVLHTRQYRFSRAREILLNDQETGFIFVLNPERLPILETKKAIELLDNYDLSVSTLVINKVLPKEADGHFMMERKKHERKYVQLIEKTFHNRQLVYIPLFSQDIVSPKQLELFSEYFQGDD